MDFRFDIAASLSVQSTSLVDQQVEHILARYTCFVKVICVSGDDSLVMLVIKLVTLLLFIVITVKRKVVLH